MQLQPPSSPRHTSPIRRPNSPTATQHKTPNVTPHKRIHQRYPTSTSSKPNATPSSRKNNVLILFGIIIVFSVVTNIFYVWDSRLSGQPSYHAMHYGMGGVDSTKMDAAWSPTKKDNIRRVFRDGKIKRRPREKRGVGSRGVRAMNKFPDNRTNVNTIHYSRNHLQQKKQNTKSATSGHIGNNTQMTLDPMQQMTKIIHDNTSESQKLSASKSINDSKVASGGRPTGLRQFRPHPYRRKSQSSPWKLPLPASTGTIKHNRMVLLDGYDGNDVITSKSSDLKGWLTGFNNKNTNVTEEDLAWRSQTVVWENDDECVPMSEWQTTFHPTCNSMHEMDINLLLHDNAFSLVSSKGHWRNAWKVDVDIAQANGLITVKPSKYSPKTTKFKDNVIEDTMDKYAVVKSLKYIHEPNEEIFELSRVDAVSLDVLTQSPFIINIYGYCGSSSIQEFAGGDLKGLLPKLDPIDKLRMAAWVAEGIADVHAVDSLVSGGQRSVNNDTMFDKSRGHGNDTAVPLIHNDINMDNVLLGQRKGIKMPILNDFNIAVFRKKHKRNGKPCQFRGRFANPQWMSPEQQERSDELSTGFLNEKIDVYALGNILYKIAVGNSPWKYEYRVSRITPEKKAKIARAKLRGAKPKVPPEVRNSTDPSIIAVLTAMDRCYRNDAVLRPSARELATFLRTELDAVELPNNEWFVLN